MSAAEHEYDGGGDRRAALAVFLILLGVYTACFSGLPDNPDAEVEFQTASSLARTGRLALGGTPEAAAIVAQRFDVHEGGPGREGRWYSWFGLGQAFVALPFYAAGRALAPALAEIEARHAPREDYGSARSEYTAHLFVGWRNPLLGALTGALLVGCARRLGASRRSALLAALAYGLCTFALAQARSTLSDVQAAFFLTLAWSLALAARARARRGEAPGALLLASLGGALGLAFLTRLVAAPAVLVLAAAATAVVGRGPRALVRLACIGAPLAACAALFLYANWARFGDPLESGYGAGVSSSFFSFPPHWGLAGLLVSPGKGLIWLAPAIALVPLGIARARAGGERLWPWTTLGVSAAILGPIACAQTWHGAWTYGPRYALPALPFAWLGVALALDALETSRARRIFGRIALAIGAVTSLPAALVDHMTHQDLALQVAPLAVEHDPALTERDRDEAFFQTMQWDWRFAAPWAHWRIFARRLADPSARPQDETFSADLFGLASDVTLTPRHERERGFLHLAWVDLASQLGGPSWPGPALALLFLLPGLWLARAGPLERSRARPNRGSRRPGRHEHHVPRRPAQVRGGADHPRRGTACDVGGVV